MLPAEVLKYSRDDRVAVQSSLIRLGYINPGGKGCVSSFDILGNNLTQHARKLYFLLTGKACAVGAS